MDPSKSPLNQNQQNRLNSILNTSPPNTPTPGSTTPPDISAKPSSTPTPNSLGVNTSPQPTDTQPSTTSPLGGPQIPTFGQGATPASTYQVPTVGISTQPANPLATLPTPTTAQPELKPSTNKPMNIKSGFPMMTLLYVIGGLVLLVVYAVIWVVVFNLELPFGITLPF